MRKFQKLPRRNSVAICEYIAVDIAPTRGNDIKHTVHIHHMFNNLSLVYGFMLKNCRINNKQRRKCLHVKFKVLKNVFFKTKTLS